MSTVSALDVASYILQKRGPMTAMKLQKLVYYCQAWNLVWEEEPLFHEEIQAWVNGPIVPELYFEHKGIFKVESIPGKIENLSPKQMENIDSVLEFYGDKNAQWLSDLTHMEEPWKSAREGLGYTEKSNNEITQASMHEYYSGIQDNG